MNKSKSQDLLYGRNPVLETLRAGRRELHRLTLQEGLDPDPLIDELKALAGDLALTVEVLPRHELDRQGRNHQGVVLDAGPYPYADLPEVLRLAQERGEPALILLLDQLKDPQNFGTLLRTAEAVGVHGVLLPVRHSVGVTPAVVSASSGASEHLLIVRVNLAQAIKTLKEEEIWFVGLERSEEAQSLVTADLAGPLGLVVGSEGSGIRPLVRDSCDFMITIPMRGVVDSLNASVAGSLALYRIWEARGFKS